MNLHVEHNQESVVTLDDWERRKEFLGFTDEDARLLRQLRPAAEAFVDDVVEELYRRLLDFEEAKAFLKDPGVLVHVKAAQRAYFLGLTAGDYGKEYLTDRLRIGRTHQRIGLPPRWYMGTYSLYMQLVLPRVMAAVAPAEKAHRSFSALLKLVGLDTELAVSTYIAARDEVIGRQGRDLAETERALHEAERFAVLGEMAGTIAHELSQPLQVINIACSAAREELADAAARRAVPDGAYVQERLERVGAQIEAVTKVLRSLRGFVRDTTDDREAPFDPAIAVRRAINLTRYGVRQAHGTLSARVGEGLPSVVGSLGKLEQALINLIGVARDSGSRSIDIAADALSRDDRNFVRIGVDVSGVQDGVLSEASLASIAANPWDTGPGLGLRIFQRIIGELNGKISVTTRPQGSVRVEILLPAVEARVGAQRQGDDALESPALGA